MTLVASLLINLITLAAEVGGAALVLQLLFDVNVSTLILLSVLALLAIVYFVPFGASSASLATSAARSSCMSLRPCI